MRKHLEKLAQRRVGQTLRQRWHIDRLLDVGGMAAVYVATHRNGNRVAVKVLHDVYAKEEETKQRFLREGYVANQVGHPGSVTVLDDDVMEDGTPFLVMELLEGLSLEDRLKRPGRLPLPSVLFIADQVLDVLVAAHAQGIIHRDIKPPNIYLTRDGQAKVLDFGLARIRQRSLQGVATRTGMVVGTASYMPPEQARGKHDLVDERTDIWAVGATLFRALTGRYVHEGETVNERLIAAMSQKARSVAAVEPSLPAPVVEVIDRALQFQKSERWRDASSMQRAVRDTFESIVGRPLAAGSLPEEAASLTPPVATEEDSLVVDIHVSFEPDASGESIIITVDGEEDEERYSIRRKSEGPPSEQDDVISEVSVVELKEGEK